MAETKTGKRSRKAAETNEEHDAGDNVDKIRDILFGQQLRDFERKFAQIEDRLNSDLESLRGESQRQNESLQTYIDSEAEILSGKLKTESETRQQQLDDLQDELKKLSRQIETRLSDLSGQIEQQARDFNQKLLKHSQEAGAAMKQQQEQLRQRMDEQHRSLSDGKVDRSALAEMLTSLALQLTADEDRN
jgi:DNA repair exonuclease SbcCD ATPase subunit